MAESYKKLGIISGSTHELFAKKVCNYLGIKQTEVEVSRHPDSETFFEVKESVREQHIFIIQSKNLFAVNDNIMELLIMIHTCKLASSNRITAVLTYYPYSRKTKKDKPRSPITAKLLASLLERAGADHIITMDLHRSQIQGFFDIPVDNLLAEPTFVKYIRENIPHWKKAVIVSPDAGGAKRASSLASKLQLEFALIHRQKNKQNRNKINLVLVGDVNEKMVIVIDDIIDTFSTISTAIQKLKESNVSKIYVIATHGVFSENSIKKVPNDSVLEKLIVTNTLPQEHNQKQCKKLSVIDMSSVFAESIRRTHKGISVSYLFDH